MGTINQLYVPSPEPSLLPNSEANSCVLTAQHQTKAFDLSCALASFTNVPWMVFEAEMLAFATETVDIQLARTDFPLFASTLPPLKHHPQQKKQRILRIPRKLIRLRGRKRYFVGLNVFCPHPQV